MVWRKQHSSHGELSRFLLTSCFFRRCKCRTIWPGWRTWPAILRKQDFHQITQQSGESLAVDHIEQFRCTARSPPCRICLLDDILVAYFAGSEIRWYDGSRLCRIGIYNGRLGLGGAKQISSATNTVWHTLLLVDLSERELATFSMTAQLSEQSIWSMRTEIEDLPWPSGKPRLRRRGQSKTPDDIVGLALTPFVHHKNGFQNQWPMCQLQCWSQSMRFQPRLRRRGQSKTPEYLVGLTLTPFITRRHQGTLLAFCNLILLLVCKLWLIARFEKQQLRVALQDAPDVPLVLILTIPTAATLSSNGGLDCSCLPFCCAPSQLKSRSTCYTMEDIGNLNCTHCGWQ